MNTRVGLGGAALAAVAVLLGACGGDQAEPAQQAGAAPSLEIEVLQYRRDVADRRVQVQVTNPGASPVVVDAVELRAAGFVRLPAVEKGSTVRPGATVDLPVMLGDVLCDEQPSRAEVRLRAAGAAEPFAVVPRGAEVLAEVHERECAEHRTRDAVDIAFDTASFTRTGSGTGTGGAAGQAVTGVLRVEPRGDQPVRVTVIEGTTLFAVTATGLPLDVPVGAAHAEVPVRLAPQRCDAHAVGESKRGYRFGVRVTVGDGNEVVLPVSPEEEGRSLLEATLLDACGLS